MDSGTLASTQVAPTCWEAQRVLTQPRASSSRAHGALHPEVGQRHRHCPGPSSGARRPPLLQEEEFGMYALYSKNKPQSDALLCSHGNAFFKVTSLPLKPRCPRPGPG